MTAEPDAWDECASCGHDYDDHRVGDHHGPCLGTAAEPLGCPCEGFEAAA